MKVYLQNLIKQKENRLNEIRSIVAKSSDVEEVRRLSAEMESVQKELNGAKEQLSKLEQNESRSNAPLNPLATYGERKAEIKDSDVEYRVAFGNFITRGTPIPAELRATTTTTDVSAVIPDNLVNQIIEKIEAVGMILPLVTRTSYPVGQRIPIDGVKPTASWVGEGAGSTPVKKTAPTSITFSAFKLRCEVSYTQEVSVQTLAVFESLFVKQVSEAMVKAIESKILSNDAGTASPSGIFYNPNEATEPDKAVEIADSTDINYATLLSMESKLPQQYDGDSIKWLMSKTTFIQFLSMLDDNGQPVARINQGLTGKLERTLLGRGVILTGDYLPSIAKTVTADTVIGCLFNLSDYVLNTSYDLGVQSAVDWDTEDHRTKAVMSVDGKVIRRDSLVKLVQKASS